MNDPRHTPHVLHRGSILVTTVWLLTILALLALGVSYRASLELRLARYQTALTQATLASWAGFYRAVELLSLDDASSDSLSDLWAMGPHLVEQPVGHSDVTTRVQISDEQSRLNLNVASSDQIELLPLMNADVAAAIVAFLQPSPSPEDAYYSTLDPPYTTKGVPFESLAELHLVRGMTPERWDIIARFCTIYPTEGAPVNLNTAPPEVLLAVGLSSQLVEQVLTYRQGNDGEVGTADDGVIEDIVGFLPPEEYAALLSTLGVSSATFRVRSEGRADEGRVVKIIEAVLERPTEVGQPVRLFAWSEP